MSPGEEKPKEKPSGDSEDQSEELVDRIVRAMADREVRMSMELGHTLSILSLMLQMLKIEPSKFQIHSK